MIKYIKNATFLALLFLFQNTQAQYFGQNKTKYKKFDFKVVESKNFETYHYLKNDSLIISFVKDAEKWKKRHGYVFKDSFAYKIPIILYNNHADFQQTSVVSGLIGTSTGGVTEGLKNRVTMPLTPSHSQNDHVLGHELVHAHQYNLIKASDSLSFNNLANIPLWMIEGMAEFMSLGSIDEHTAMWMRDAVAYNYFPTVKKLNEPRYFPYRFGHDFWAFVSGTFGDEKMEPLFVETAKLGLKDAFLRELGMSVDTFSTKWKTTTENYYKPLIKDRTLEGIGKKLINIDNGGRLNISPAISPDGKYFIFFSEKDLFSIDLYLADAQTGKIIKKLATKTKQSHADDIDGFESAGAWSPDNDHFAFVIYSQGRKKMTIASVKENKVVDEFFIDAIPAFDNIDWSPDGSKIVFTGLVNGQSDLYTIDVKSKEIKQLTNDYFAQTQPKWSPDGSKIVYISDALNENEAKPNKNFSIFILDYATLKTEKLPLFKDSNNMNPLFAPDGNKIYFLSDRDGFRDLYSYDLDNEKIHQFTQFVTGISGITNHAPAISISQTNAIIYSLYQDSNYNIYTFNIDETTNPKEVDLTSINKAAAVLPSMFLQDGFVNKLLENENIVPETGKMTQEPYKPKFKLDYISNGGVGVSSGRYGTGMMGGVNMLFGDMLNDNQLYVGALINGEIQDFGGQVAYLNSKSRLGWGGNISHVPYRTDYYSDSFDDSTSIYTQIQYTYRMFQNQASFFSYYPFSKAERMEFSTSANFYSFRLDKETFPYYYNGYYFIADYDGYKRDRNIYVRDPIFINDFNIAYVGDDSSFGMASPMKGYRYRMELQQSVGNINMTTALVDLRKYFYLKPVGFAVRALTYNRLGNGAANDILPPLYLGYETIVRGYTSNAIYSQDINSDILDFYDIMGSQMITGSFEVRLPFTGPERLAAIKSGFLFSDLNLFFDTGVAWGYHYEYDAYYNEFLTKRNYNDSKWISSLGVSARINLFGQLILEPYYAFPLNLNKSGGVFGLNFVPGW